MVEHDLAKVGVAGSTPVSRSICIVFIVSLISFLNAQTIQLKSHYFIDSYNISLHTFGISKANTTIMKLPGERTLWRVPAFEIKERLKKIGYDCKTSNSTMITFELATKKSFPKLQNFIKEKYKDSYPTLRIEAVSLKPTGRGKNEDLKPECSVRLPKNSLRKKSGTFVMKCEKNRYYFHYRVYGTILVYKANHQIKKDKIIDSNSVYTEYMPFERFYAPPLSNFTKGIYMAKLNIAADKILTSANTQPLPAVLKGSLVRCFYKVDSITIEFEARALQNGNVGDRIIVKKNSGKTLRGLVVGNGRVELK